MRSEDDLCSGRGIQKFTEAADQFSVRRVRSADAALNFGHWWQGWPSGESTCLPPMWLGFDFRTRRHTWIEFVGSLLCYERFSAGYSGFPLSPKTNI